MPIPSALLSSDKLHAAIWPCRKPTSLQNKVHFFELIATGESIFTENYA